VIVRILHEGQYEVEDALLEELNRLDDALTAALDGSDETAFRSAVLGLLTRVREAGTPLAPDDLRPSDAVVPGADATRDEVRAILTDEGVIPG
jgi:hypothetical protein